jgi:hypothetical protein
VIGSLQVNVSYSVRLRAVNAIGTGTISSPLVFSIEVPLTPGLRFASFTSLGGNCFSIFNTGAIGIFNGTPDVSGIVQYVHENYSDFGVSQYQNDMSIMISGLFFAEISGEYTFVFYDTNTNLANDDLSYFYIGENTLYPSMVNINKAVYYPYGPGDCLYTVTLEAGTYTPILMFYGQSGGGTSLALGVVFPNSAQIVYNDLPVYLAPETTQVSNIGLRIYLDAGNTSSYNVDTAPEQWNSLVSNDYVFTLYNSPSYNSINQSIVFQSNLVQYGKCLTALRLNTWSLEVWLYFDNSNTNAPSIITSIVNGSSSAINYALGIINYNNFETNRIYAYIENGGYRQTSVTVSQGWHHIVGTYNNNTITIYLNGVNTISTDVGSQINYNDNGIYLMHRWNEDSGDTYGGQLGVVRIYERALSPSEVSANFELERSRYL